MDETRMPHTVDRPGYITKGVSLRSLLEVLIDIPSDRWDTLMVKRDDADNGPIGFDLVEVTKTEVIFK